MLRRHFIMTTAAAALAALRSHPLGRDAVIAGTAVREHPGMLVLRTGLGGTRIVDMLPGDQLRFELEMVQFRGKTCKMKGVAYVDGKVAVEAEMMAAVVDR